MVHLDKKGRQRPYFDLVLGGSDDMVVLVLEHMLDLSGVNHLLLNQDAVGHFPNIKIASHTSADEVMIVLGDKQRGHCLVHADPEFRLLRVIGPHVEEGFIDLLAEDLLATRVVGETGEEAVVAILMQDCGCLGVEEEELSVFLGADDEALLGWQDHSFNFVNED